MKPIVHACVLIMMTVVLHACASSQTQQPASATSAPTASDPAPEAGVPALDVLLARHFEARGGVDKVRSVQSLVQRGDTEVQGLTMPQTIYRQRPGKMRTEVGIPGMDKTLVSGFDGEQGWEVNPLPGGGPREASARRTRRYAVDADLDGVLVDHREKGYTIAQQGQERVRGQMAYKLLVTHPQMKPITIYLDAKTHLERMRITEGIHAGRTVNVETYLSDYREIDGLMIPYKIEDAIQGNTISIYTLSEVRINDDLDPYLFIFPVTLPDIK